MTHRSYLALALAAVILLAGGFLMGRSASAAGTTPGTDADPLVSKSYVDQYTQWVPVQVKAGQTITGEGGTEFILRSGKAVAVETGGAGLADVTAAKDLLRGVSIPLNHLLLVPRTDGRGLKVSVDSWVLVRGAYSIQ